MIKREDFITWVVDEMKRRGLNRNRLAIAGEMSNSLVTMVLNGDSGPGPVFCRGVARAFNLPEQEIFQRAGLVAGPAVATGTPGRIAEIAARLDEDAQAELLRYSEYLLKERPTDEALINQAKSLTPAGRKKSIETGRVLTLDELNQNQSWSGNRQPQAQKSLKFAG
jgi:transcriptional regulator with XRE-family HTH domain